MIREGSVRQICTESFTYYKVRILPLSGKHTLPYTSLSLTGPVKERKATPVKPWNVSGPQIVRSPSYTTGIVLIL